MNNLATIKLVGNNVTTISEFKDVNGVTVTPSNVALKYKDPTGVVTTASITQLSNLKYTSTVYLNVAGDWVFRWECTGNYATSEEFIIQVLPSQI
jgi:hypothetical protein